jgi:hypothetical protein
MHIFFEKKYSDVKSKESNGISIHGIGYYFVAVLTGVLSYSRINKYIFKEKYIKYM